MYLTDNGLPIRIKDTSPEGYKTVTATLACIGIQKYYVGELNRDELPARFKSAAPSQIIRIRRPKSVVLSDANSWNHLPVTINHPTVDLNPRNYAEYARGTTLGNGRFESDREVVNELKLTDSRAISAAKSLKFVSAGYDSAVNWDDSSEEFDGTITTIELNHIALCEKARGGESMKLHDSWKEGKMAERTVKGIGIITFKDEDAGVVDSLIKQNQEIQKEIDTVKGASAGNLQKLTDENKKLVKQNEELKEPKRLQSIMDARIALMDSVKKLCPDLKIAEQSDRELKEAVIKSKYPELKIVDSEDWVNGLFSSFSIDEEQEEKTRKNTKNVFKDSTKKGGKSGDKDLDPLTTAMVNFAKRNAGIVDKKE